MLHVDLLGFRRLGLAQNADVAAADGLYPQVPDLNIPGEGGKIHGVWVHPLPVFLGKDDFGLFRPQGGAEYPVSAVAHAGFA